MHHSAFRAAVSALLVSALAAAGAFAAPTAVPGTQVMLDPPEGFVPAERFAGFQRAEIGASIMVTELPGPAAEMLKAMTRDGLASRGMLLLASEPLKVGGEEALLLRINQRAGNTQYFKWMLVTGDDRQTVMVTATYPQAAAAQWGASMRKAVLSATRDPKAVVDPWAGLSFRVTPGPSLKIANRAGNSLILIEADAPASGGPGETVYVVGSSHSDPAIDDLEAFSKQRAENVPQVKNLRSVQGRTLAVDGLRAYELVAQGDDARSGEPVRLYQTIAKEDGGYVIFLGVVAEKRAEAVIPSFRRVTDTFKRLPRKS